MKFKISGNFTPKGDQAKVIQEVSKRIEKDNSKFQTIIGATGTGKTYVMAKIIESLQQPALIIAHNKTLAAQLYREFCEFFPKNAVEYFVSYYDYYQPEAYVAKRDLYIEKESSINEEIDRMRLKATAALIERKDVIVISSVSCIYGLGSPDNYKKMYLFLEIGLIISRQEFIKKLLNIQYERNDKNLERGNFRVRGDVIDIIPAYSKSIYRIEFFGNEIEFISKIDPLNNQIIEQLETITIFPAKHFIVANQELEKACYSIEKELQARKDYYEKKQLLLEKERITSRTLYDLELLRSVGHCSGIENYSRHLTGKKIGERPNTLLDYFPSNFITFIDESHVTTSQIGGMFNGDRARKTSLVEHGFRLPSALDNRPLYFEEFINLCNHFLFVSATPGNYELKQSKYRSELINRPTGLLDPIIEIQPTIGQIDHLLGEIKGCILNKDKILITTLTKKMSEDLTTFLKEQHIKVNYLHSEIETIERVEIIKSLREGKIDVLVGINLLREGLDIPEVALVAIMDADKTGFLRSATSLIQTVGRAARHKKGKAIFYADKMSEAMQECIDTTNYRRNQQILFNKKHNIIPTSIIKPIYDILKRKTNIEKDVKNKEILDLSLNKNSKEPVNILKFIKSNSKKVVKEWVKTLETEMQIAADIMNFEKAIELRETIKKTKDLLKTNNIE